MMVSHGENPLRLVARYLARGIKYQVFGIDDVVAKGKRVGIC